MKIVKITFVVILGTVLVFGLFLANLFYDITSYKSDWRGLNDRMNYSQVIIEADNFESRADNRFYSLFDMSFLVIEKVRLDFLIAEAAFRSKDGKRARKHYGNIINLNIDGCEKLISKAYYNRSVIALFEERVRIGEVKGDLEMALVMDPYNTNAKHNLEILNILLAEKSKSKGKGVPKSGDQGFEMGDIVKDLWRDGDSKKAEKEEKKW